MNGASERKKFEAWISGRPYNECVLRFSDDPTRAAWPGNYRSIKVQIAWEAWQQALTEKESTE